MAALYCQWYMPTTSNVVVNNLLLSMLSHLCFGSRIKHGDAALLPHCGCIMRLFWRWCLGYLSSSGSEVCGIFTRSNVFHTWDAWEAWGGVPGSITYHYGCVGHGQGGCKAPLWLLFPREGNNNFTDNVPPYFAIRYHSYFDFFLKILTCYRFLEMSKIISSQ